MGSLPFTVSPEAAAWIVTEVQRLKNRPITAGLVPILDFSFNAKMKDVAGRVLESWPKPFFHVGWDPPERAAAGGLLELEILGVKLFASPGTLKRLKRKQLVLQTVEVGYPTPADKKRQLLRAVPKGRAKRAGNEKGPSD